MAARESTLFGVLLGRLRTTVGVRFTRFVRVALASLVTSEATLAACDGLFHLTAIPAAVTSWFTGAVVSYLLSRWAWERRGRPDLLRETVPFWAVSAVVVLILSGSTKFGYRAAAWMHLHGFEHVAFVGAVYLLANCVTFVARFLIFHYILFADRRQLSEAVAAGDAPASPDTQQAGVG